MQIDRNEFIFFSFFFFCYFTHNRSTNFESQFSFKHHSNAIQSVWFKITQCKTSFALGTWRYTFESTRRGVDRKNRNPGQLWKTEVLFSSSSTFKRTLPSFVRRNYFSICRTVLFELKNCWLFYDNFFYLKFCFRSEKNFNISAQNLFFLQFIALRN